MGYDLHVTRAPAWYDAETAPIGRDEVLALVATDPTLRVDPTSWAGRRTPDGGEVRVEAVLFDGDHPDPDAFWADQGEILAKYPSDAAIVKLVELARRLGARVQGDDGEVYDVTDDGRKRVNGVVVGSWNEGTWPEEARRVDPTDLPFDPRTWPIVEAGRPAASRTPPRPVATDAAGSWSAEAPASPGRRPRTSILVAVVLSLIGFFALRAWLFSLSEI